MSEANKALVRRVIDEIWTGGNLELIDELYAEDFRCHFEPGDDWRGRAEVREWVSRMHASLGEYRERVDELVAEGDRVAVRVTLTGVGNAGRKSVSSLGILIYRIADGRIAEQWEVGNVAGIMEQLGFAPAAPLS